jgi:hypothetical protein
MAESKDALSLNPTKFRKPTLPGDLTPRRLLAGSTLLESESTPQGGHCDLNADDKRYFRLVGHTVWPRASCHDSKRHT